MNKYLGKKSMNAFLTHGAILCVAGVRKLTFRTPVNRKIFGVRHKYFSTSPIVTTTLRVTRIMVKRRYLPRRGTARDVGGIISASNKKNTVSERRILMERLTCDWSVKC